MRCIPRIYHKVNLHAQRDGRWSWVDPPLAQVPVDLLDVYVPDASWPWLQWDHDAIEVRIHAAMAGDLPYLAALDKGYDTHLIAYCDGTGDAYPPQLVNACHAPENAEWFKQRKWKECDHGRGVCAKDDDRRHFWKTFSHRMCKGGDPKASASIPSAKALGLDGAKLVRAAHAWFAAHPAIAAYHRRVAAEIPHTRLSRTWRGRPRRYLSDGRHLTEEALAHVDQAGTQDIENAIILEVKRRFAGDVYLGICRHDSQTWAIRRCQWERIVPEIKRIAQQPRRINGIEVAFPASFKIRYAPGEDASSPCRCGRC